MCGTEYDTRFRMAAGATWKDVYSGTPFDYLTRWQRRCTAQVDVESEEPLAEMECVVYFHGDRQKRVSFM